MRNEFTLNCMEIIEAIVSNDTYLVDETINNIYKEYTEENMIQAIKYINKEFTRLGLNIDTEYINAYNRLKEILSNISTLKEVYNICGTVEIKDNSFLTICNETHHNNKYFTISIIDNKKYLSIKDHGHNINSYNDLWSSKEDNIILAKDKYNNIYKFQYINNKYSLIDAYTINKKQLLKDMIYNSIYGTCKVI